MKYLAAKFIKEVLGNGKLSAITLVGGDEEYLIKSVLDGIKSAYQYRSLWGDEIDIDELKGEVLSQGMFSQKSQDVCIIYRTELFLKSLKKKEMESFKGLLNGPSSKLVFVVNHSLSDKELSKEPLKTISSKGDVVLCNRLGKQKVKELVKRKFEREGDGIEEEALELLLSMTGADLMLLKHESEKLLIYAGKRKVTVQDVKSVCFAHAGAGIFEFIDAFFDKDLARALASLRSLLSTGVSPLQVQALLVSYAVKLYTIQRAIQEGEPLESALTKAGVNHPFMKLKFKNFLRKFEKGEGARLLEELYALDLKTKSFYGSPEENLEEFLLKRLVVA